MQERAPKEAEEAVFQLRNIHRDNFTVEGCMEAIESRLSVGTVRFTQLFSGAPDREEVVTLFMALLELLKLGKAHVMQTDNFGEMTLLPGRKESDPEGPEETEGAEAVGRAEKAGHSHKG